jgi:hypothetical protein
MQGYYEEFTFQAYNHPIGNWDREGSWAGRMAPKEDTRAQSGLRI